MEIGKVFSDAFVEGIEDDDAVGVGEVAVDGDVGLFLDENFGFEIAPVCVFEGFGEGGDEFG